jgi:hypothetical protein
VAGARLAARSRVRYEQAVHDEEELVLPVVFVPVELALHDAQPHEDTVELD